MYNSILDFLEHYGDLLCYTILACLLFWLYRACCEFFSEERKEKPDKSLYDYATLEKEVLEESKHARVRTLKRCLELHTLSKDDMINLTKSLPVDDASLTASHLFLLD